MAKVKVNVKAKAKVNCQSCKCFNVKRKDVKRWASLPGGLARPPRGVGKYKSFRVDVLIANKVENKQKSCTTYREIKFILVRIEQYF